MDNSSCLVSRATRRLEGTDTTDEKQFSGKKKFLKCTLQMDQFYGTDLIEKATQRKRIYTRGMEDLQQGIMGAKVLIPKQVPCVL